MRSIKAHVFQSVNDANNAISQINTNQGIPVSESAITRTYCNLIESNGVIYIEADKITESVLGLPVDIEINENNF